MALASQRGRALLDRRGYRIDTRLCPSARNEGARGRRSRGRPRRQTAIDDAFAAPPAEVPAGRRLCSCAAHPHSRPPEPRNDAAAGEARATSTRGALVALLIAPVPPHGPPAASMRARATCHCRHIKPAWLPSLNIMLKEEDSFVHSLSPPVVRGGWRSRLADAAEHCASRHMHASGSVRPCRGTRQMHACPRIAKGAAPHVGKRLRPGRRGYM
eukprot:scaffold3673_cov393-Prasinococcus_capsulatus_cf.AAC.15